MKRSKNGSQYPDDWTKIATDAKNKTGWCCERCGHRHEKGYILTVHHLDMDPANDAWWNLAALCQRCHLRIQGKVVLAQDWMFDHSRWFVPHVAGYYAHLLCISEDKEYVTTHADEIIELYRVKFGGLSLIKYTE